MYPRKKKKFKIIFFVVLLPMASKSLSPDVLVVKHYFIGKIFLNAEVTNTKDIENLFIFN